VQCELAHACDGPHSIHVYVTSKDHEDVNMAHTGSRANECIDPRAYIIMRAFIFAHSIIGNK
jgi:hypothetical protein